MDAAGSTSLIVSVGRHQIVRYMNVCSMAVLIFDWMISLSEEVQLVWQTRWSVANVLYLLSRYLPYIDTTLNVLFYVQSGIDTKTCLRNYTASTWSTGLGMGISEVILMWRTYIIWEQSKRLLYTFCVLWILWIIGNGYIVTVFIRSLQFDPQPLSNLPGCNLVNGADVIFISYASFLLMEIFLVIMTLIKGVQHMRHRNSPLIATLYRDGIMFFIYLACLSLGNVILLVTAPVEYLDLLNTVTRVLHSVLCCRVVLHIRGVTPLVRRRARTTTWSWMTGVKSFGPRRSRTTRPVSDIQLTTMPDFAATTYQRTTM